MSNSRSFYLILLSTTIIQCAQVTSDQLTIEQQIFNNNSTELPSQYAHQQSINPISISTDHNECTPTRSRIKKPWTFMIYMAADNDLRAFASNNIKQMTTVGSNNFINILVHLDIRLNGNQKITRRYYVDKSKIIPIEQRADTTAMDSGDPKTLVSFCEWAIDNYPAQDYALILWNHGTGIIDPKHYKIINPADLFMFNPNTHKLDLDRSVGFLDLLSCVNVNMRGVCLDSTTGNYLTNQKLETALHEIYIRVLGGQKLSIVGFDACLMSMLEVANISKNYAKIMVGSQEVELGTGWNYAHVLQPFTTNSLDCTPFAQHIVDSYQKSYQHITNDYTQSVIDLDMITDVEHNVDTVAQLLITCLSYQHNNSVKNAIMLSRDVKLCTCFDEPSYIDLHHFYRNLSTQLSTIVLINHKKDYLIHELDKALSEGISLIPQSVLANAVGKNLKMACGISIYFPEQHIHTSYQRTNFAKSNAWYKFLSFYLQQ